MEFRKAIQIKTGKVYKKHGRRIAGFYAGLGEISEQGASVQEAIEKLQKRLESLPDVTGTHAKTRTIAGYTLVIIPEDCGARVLLVHPDSHVSEFTTPETDFAAIEENSRINVAQLLWPTEPVKAWDVVCGSARMESDFKSWVTFQMKYREAREQGYNDTQAHAIACGMEHLAGGSQ